MEIELAKNVNPYVAQMLAEHEASQRSEASNYVFEPPHDGEPAYPDPWDDATTDPWADREYATPDIPPFVEPPSIEPGEPGVKSDDGDEAEPTSGSETPPTRGQRILDEVRAQVEKYVILPSPDATTGVVLWIAATYGTQWFEHATRLAIHSPEKRCGKSRLLEVIEALVFQPLATTNASVAALFRLIAAAGETPPTLLIDETDRLFGTRQSDDDNRDLIGLLNNGFRPGKPTIRCVGPQSVATEFPNFAFAALAGIGRLPDTIEDRAVNITMRRRLPDETVARYRLRTDRPALEKLGERLGGWVASLGESLGDEVADMPNELEDRSQDAWEPLVAIADMAGGEWPRLARRAAVKLTREQADDHNERSTRLLLLGDVRRVFEGEGSEFVASSDLLAALEGLPESPWREWGLTVRRLAQHLKEFGVKPDRNRSQTARGYHLKDLADPFRRYLLAGEPSKASNPSITHSDKGEHIDGSKTVDGYKCLPENTIDGSKCLPENKCLPETPSQTTIQTDRRIRRIDGRNETVSTGVLACTACNEPMFDLGDGSNTHPGCGR